MKTDLKKMLSRVDMFEGLSDEQLEVLKGIAQTVTYAGGKLIFLAGEEAAGFYIVGEGRVRVFRTAPNGKEHILHLFGPGETFGEVAMFEGKQFPASAEALEQSELIYFPRRRFEERIKQNPDLAMRMLGLLSRRLRLFVHKIEELSFTEIPTRLAAHLLLLRSVQGTDTLKLDLPKRQLAAYLGTIPETLSRVLKKMSKDGLLQTQGREIVLLDVPRLQKAAEAHQE